MRPFWFGDVCEDGHLLHPTGDPGRSYECERCGMGFWDAGEATEDFDVDAYAHALGAQ